MDKLEKAYRKLNAFEQSIVDRLYQKLALGDTLGLNIKKLRGYLDVYRIRKGRVRIIYRNSNGKIEILEISLRDSHTYKNF